MTIDQISVFVENGPGKLTDVTRTLADAEVDLRAMSIADTADFGILRIIVNDAQKAKDALSAASYVTSVTQVLAVEIEDKLGSLSSVLAVLSDANISVEYLYAFITRKVNDAYVIMRVEDVEAATDVLAAKGVRTLGQSDLYAL
jgi:hypothetical protein